MSKIYFTFALAALLALLGLSPVHAQQPSPEPPASNPVPKEEPKPQVEGLQVNQSDRYEARRASTKTERQGPTVKKAVLQKLVKANKAEIELAKMAMEKTDHQALKQLCQTIVQDHQALNNELQQMVDMKSDGDSTNLATMNKPTVPTELCQIADQAGENALKMTKEMLAKYDGQDFNMAFLGQQIVAHMMMLAELEAIQSVGPQGLESVTQEAISKVEMHLKKSKELAKKLEKELAAKQS